MTMSEAETWARAVYERDKPLREGVPSSAFGGPCLAVQQVTHNVFLSGGPRESFSLKMPAYAASSPEEIDLAPIDVLYGRYEPKSRSIEVYVRRIEQDAVRFRVDPSDLLALVRLHQYAHAIVHLGVAQRDVKRQLSEYGSGTSTDWEAFSESRLSAIAVLGRKEHEMLAQAITWACLAHHPQCARLSRVFTDLEERQPPEYKLSPVVKRTAYQTFWPIVLDATRGRVESLKGESFSMFAALEALVVQTAQPLPANDSGAATGRSAEFANWTRRPER